MLRSRRLRSSTGRRPSSVSRLTLSLALGTGTGIGAAGRERTSTAWAESSTPPGARGSSRRVPVTTTAASSGT